MKWEEDFKIGKKAEHELAAMLIMKWNITWWEEPEWKFSDYDMKLKTAKWEFTVEVKNDNIWPTTKRVWIEYECKGRPSWIATSKADYYVFKLWDDFWMTSRGNLINLVIESKTKEKRQWWDDWTAKLWIIPEEELYSIAQKIWKD